MLQSFLNGAHQQKVYTIITGASHGLGEALAIESAKNGRHIILLALPDSGLNETAKRIRENNYTDVLTYELDLTQEQALYDFHDWTEKNGYQIDTLINNAGTGGSTHFAEAPADYLNTIILLNIRALAILTRLFISELKRHDRAGILNVSSMAAFSPIPFKSVYPASKAFVYSFSIGLKEELRGTNVSVSVLHPGPMATSEEIKVRMGKHGWLAKKSLISTENMAKAAYKGMLSKRGVIIPGRLNRISMRLMALLPLSIKLPMLSRMFQRELTVRHEI